MSAQDKETKELHQFADAIGFLCQQKRTGGLRIRAEAREGEVFLQEGRITHAQFGPFAGLKALLFMLTWEQGTYNFTPQQTIDQTTIEMETAEVLSLLGQQLEEWKRIARDQSLSLDTVLRLLPQASGTVRLTKEEWSALARIDGKKSLEDLSYEMNLPPLDVVKAMQRFRKAGLIGIGRRHPEPASAVFGVDYLSALEKELKLAVGPVASIVLEEALKDLQVAGGPLTEDQIEILLERLSKAIAEEEKRSDFQQTVRSLTKEFSDKERPLLQEEQEETR
jgi:DNA-binding MarR family transcriptional regulator